MKKSKQESAETRERIVQTAGREFRRNGIAATGVSDLMGAAGLTHGGFYRHFESKDSLVAEACAAALNTNIDAMSSAVAKKRGRAGLKTATTKYLSTRHRDNPATGCPLAALGSEFARGDDDLRAAATEGFQRMVGVIQSQLEMPTRAAARRRAIATVCAMVGALIMSRVANSVELSEAILSNTEQYLAHADSSR